MTTKHFNGWMLEAACGCQIPAEWRAWVSNQDRIVVGYGMSRASRRDAVRAALVDAQHHYATSPDAIDGLERLYFGPLGMSTRAKA